jgi:hypothetical protein
MPLRASHCLPPILFRLMERHPRGHLLQYFAADRGVAQEDVSHDDGLPKAGGRTSIARLRGCLLSASPHGDTMTSQSRLSRVLPFLCRRLAASSISAVGHSYAGATNSQNPNLSSWIRTEAQRGLSDIERYLRAN